ncbi:MAG: DEAD/DEAH box helicase [Bacteroidales bacterium]|jgi:replicative superfamily II helicase|nr:DEAD/DEAH box helicase [Bacteroidales bacterium]
MLLIDKLISDIQADKYFQQLFEKCLLLSAEHNLKSSVETLFADKEFIDILRYADILSNSKDPDSRNKSYQIITALNHKYSADPIYKTFSKSVFSKLGNFPAIGYLVSKNNNLAELPLLYEIELESKKIIQKVPNSENEFFTDTQFEVFSKLSNSIEFSFSGPTSMGKSFIIKSFIKKVIKNSPPENIVIIVPTRALINQFSIDLKSDLRELLEAYKYKILINSNVSDFLTEERYNYIFVLTPERLISYLSQDNNPPIGFLFLDEAHKLANKTDSRSITTYTAIEKVQKKYGNVKLYFSSPNVSNPDIFLKLFDRNTEQRYYQTDESPVSQNLYFIDLQNNNYELYANNQIINLNQQVQFSNIADELDLINFIGNGKTNLIYCNSRRKTIEKANSFASKLSGFQPTTNIKNAVSNIREYIHKDYYLANLLLKGVAFHHGKLPQLIRNVVEDLYKSEEIKNVFCTSTLLEGVNMPTQNIFILDNKNSNKQLESIDFWNLSGRAGRLAKELEGNIFCVQSNDFEWKNKKIFEKEKINIEPTILNKIDKNLIEIEKILHSKDITGTNEEKEILEYIANIIKIDSLEIDSKYKSPIIVKLIDENKNKIIELAKSKTENYEIPKFILSYNQTINFDVQNKVYKQLVRTKKTLPSSNINYKTCLEVLESFYGLYNWNKAEKKLQNKNSLKYYSVLMNEWINGFSLSQIINQTIEWNATNNNKIMVGYDNNKPSYVLFDRQNIIHINIIIEQIIEDIEYILRFLLEKYFNHYYQILVKILGENNAGENWAVLLEYGTQNRIVIALQNIGFSRNTALKINQHHRNALTTHNGKLLGINKLTLMNSFRTNSLEYDEVKKVL